MLYEKFSLLLIYLLLYIGSFAQPGAVFYDECIEPRTNSPVLRYLWNSENGYWLPTKGTYRMLVIFVNIIGLPIQNNPYWPVLNTEGINQLPPTQFYNDIFDTHNASPRNGFFTRFMSECSFDSLVILGDFTSVEINQSRIKPNGQNFDHYDVMNSVINYINNTGGLNTIYGHNTIGDFDKATCKYAPNVSRVSNTLREFLMSGDVWEVK